MPTVELLNNKKHKELRLRQQLLTSECALGSTMIMPSEFVSVQREYPILFRKDSTTGQFYPSAMLGFSQHENLFFSNDRWQSTYVPLILRRGPFLIGFQNQQRELDREKVPVIYVDVDDERISTTDGELVFAEDGERSALMCSISQVLMEIHQGCEESKEMIDIFSELNLIEPVNLSVSLHNGEYIKLSGMYTINNETLSTLRGHHLEKIHASGFLRYAYCIVNSLDNFKHLISLKNDLVTQ